MLFCADTEAVLAGWLGLNGDAIGTLRREGALG